MENLEKRETCCMIETGLDIRCNICDCTMDDEIYYMFEHTIQEDMKYCPHCGRKIEEWIPYD